MRKILAATVAAFTLLGIAGGIGIAGADDTCTPASFGAPGVSYTVSGPADDGEVILQLACYEDAFAKVKAAQAAGLETHYQGAFIVDNGSGWVIHIGPKVDDSLQVIINAQ